jgi:hypothetical protein
MKTTDIIRNILDLIDGIECAQEPTDVEVVEPEVVELEPVANAQITTTADDPNHFKQIVDLVSKGIGGNFRNSPNEHYGSIDAVTVDAGGGVNGPKHPHDIRVKDPSAYPEYKGQDFQNTVNDKKTEHKSFKDYLNDRGI